MNQPIIPHNLKQPRVYGFIYVLSNMHMPDIYKVGMTTKAPHARAAELSATTGVPMDFDVVYYAEVADPQGQEKRVHQALSQYRINSFREFFKADLFTIIQAIKDPDSAFTDDEAPIFSEWSSVPMVLIEKSFRTFVSEIEGKA